MGQSIKRVITTVALAVVVGIVGYVVMVHQAQKDIAASDSTHFDFRNDMQSNRWYAQNLDAYEGYSFQLSDTEFTWYQGDTQLGHVPYEFDSDTGEITFPDSHPESFDSFRYEVTTMYGKPTGCGEESCEIEFAR